MRRVCLVVLCLLLVAACKPTEQPPQRPPLNPDGVACTADAQQCPDGTYVGRVPPSCAFAPCLAVACKTEGEEIPGLLPEPPVCCAGLTMIQPLQQPQGEGPQIAREVMGICTAKCGNGQCDKTTEDRLNCPADC